MYIRLKNNDKNVEMNRIMEGFGYGERRRKIDGEKKKRKNEKEGWSEKRHNTPKCRNSYYYNT